MLDKSAKLVIIVSVDYMKASVIISNSSNTEFKEESIFTCCSY